MATYTATVPERFRDKVDAGIVQEWLIGRGYAVTGVGYDHETGEVSITADRDPITDMANITPPDPLPDPRQVALDALAGATTILGMRQALRDLIPHLQVDRSR